MHIIPGRIVLLFELFFFCFIVIGFGQREINSYIYSIRVTTTEEKQFIQTGFKLQGTPGIVTALHGVADAKEITAVNETGNVFSKLEIIKVDVSRDAAIIYSDNMSNLSGSGLIPVGTSQVSANDGLKVLGHPQGIDLITKSVTAGTPVFTQLKSLIPLNFAESFLKRNSPSPSIQVIYVEGNLVPGNSGSPIFDKNYNVIGIVNGGILGGAAGISWAIPITDVSFSRVSRAKNELERIKNSDTNILFKSEELTTNISSSEKHLLVDFFEIVGLDTVKKNYSLIQLDTNHLIGKSIRASTDRSLKRLAKDEVISYLQSDVGSQKIARLMNDYWELNTFGRMLTFPLNTSFNDLQRKTYEEAIEKYSIGLKYDPRLCTILAIDLDSKYSDRANAYVGTIKDVKVELNFVTARCSQKKQGVYSEEELEAPKTNWTSFVVIRTD